MHDKKSNDVYNTIVYSAIRHKMIRNLYSQVHTKSLLNCRLHLYRRPKIAYHNLARISPIIKKAEPERYSRRFFHHSLFLKEPPFAKDKGINSSNYFKHSYHDKTGKRFHNNKDGKKFHNVNTVGEYLISSSTIGAVIGGVCGLAITLKDLLDSDLKCITVFTLLMMVLSGFIIGPLLPLVVILVITHTSCIFVFTMLGIAEGTEE